MNHTDDNNDIADLIASAEAGEVKVQNYLGWLYEKGQGVEQDYAEAVRWYRKSAEQGLAQAQYNMGLLYHKSQGVAQDYAEAVHWYRKSAEQGNAKSQFNLGILYRKGRGVIQDDREAYIWCSLAVACGYENAEKERDAIGSLLLSTDRNAAREEAHKRLEQIRLRQKSK